MSTNSSMSMTEEWGAASVYTLAALIILFILVASVGNLTVMIAIITEIHKCDRLVKVSVSISELSCTCGF